MARKRLDNESSAVQDTHMERQDTPQPRLFTPPAPVRRRERPMTDAERVVARRHVAEMRRALDQASRKSA